MPWRRRKDSMRYFKRPSSRISSSDEFDPRNQNNTSPYDDEYNRKRLHEFAEK